MNKYDFGEKKGECPICGINLYEINGEIKPGVMPCNVGLFRQENRLKADRGKCPYENTKQQEKSMETLDHEKIAGILGTMHGGTFDD